MVEEEASFFHLFGGVQSLHGTHSTSMACTLCMCACACVHSITAGIHCAPRVVEPQRAVIAGCSQAVLVAGRPRHAQHSHATWLLDRCCLVHVFDVPQLH